MKKARKLHDIDLVEARRVASGAQSTQPSQPNDQPAAEQPPQQAYKAVKEQRTIRFPAGMLKEISDFLAEHGTYGDSVNKLVVIGATQEFERRKRLAEAQETIKKEGAL